MTSGAPQQRTGRVIGHELGSLLAAYTLEAERVALVALETVRDAGLGEKAARSAGLRIERHLWRIREARREAARAAQLLALVEDAMTA